MGVNSLMSSFLLSPLELMVHCTFLAFGFCHLPEICFFTLHNWFSLIWWIYPKCKKPHNVEVGYRGCYLPGSGCFSSNGPLYLVNSCITEVIAEILGPLVGSALTIAMAHSSLFLMWRC